MIAVKEYTSENIGDLAANARALRAKLYAPEPRPALFRIVPAATMPAHVIKATPAGRPELAPQTKAPAPNLGRMMALRRLIRAYRADNANYHQAFVKPGSQMVVRAIINEVAAKSGISKNDIISGSKTAPVVRARHLAIWLSARETPLSLPHLGRLFGGRDHTTILHAIRRENERRGTNVRGCGTAWKGPQQ